MLKLDLIPKVVKEPGDDCILDVMSKMVLSSVNGVLTIGEIADGTGLDPEMVDRMVHSLVGDGFLEIPGVTPEREKSKLEKNVDLAMETATSANLYDRLGIEPDCSRAELRSKYFELSKRFHPDKAFSENTKGLRHKMEVIFRHYTDAYDVLSNRMSRQEYDESIAGELELRAMEKKLRSAFDKGPTSTGSKKVTKTDNGSIQSRDQSRKPVSAPPEKTKRSSTPDGARPVISSFPSRPPAAARPSSQPPRRLSSQPPSTSSRPPGPASRPPSKPKTSSQGESKPVSVQPPSGSRESGKLRASNPSHEERRKQWKRERAGRAMAAIFNRNSSKPPQLSTSAKLLKNAENAMILERHAEAYQILEGLLKVDPENEKAKELFETAKTGANVAAAKEHLSRGMYQLRQGNLEEAQRYFTLASQTDPSNLDARHRLAEVLLDQKQDLGNALNLIKEVIGMGGKRARYYATLGELLVLAKDIPRATQAFERACALAPDDKEYKKRLKACKK